MKKKTLGFKLVVGGIVAVIVPLLVVGIFAVIKSSNALEAAAQEQAQSMAKNLAGMVQMVLLEEMKMASEMSGDGNIIEAVSALARDKSATAEVGRLETRLGAAMKNIGKDYETLFITDAVGVVVADSIGGKSRGIPRDSRLRSHRHGRRGICRDDEPPDEDRLSGREGGCHQSWKDRLRLHGRC